MATDTKPIIEAPRINELRPGRYVLGKLLNTVAGRPWKRRDGAMAEPWYAVLQDSGTETTAVKFVDHEAMTRALEGFQTGDVVWLRVDVEAGSGRGAGKVFFEGIPPRSYAE